MKPVSRTAFYCCGVRGLDARSTRPVCGDLFAERFMDEEVWRTFEPFRRFHGPNASNVMRHRILDDLLRERVARDPRRRIVLLGAGLDSRAFRLTGGRWLEVDERQVFAWKEPRLPARDSPNEIVRLGVDFETERLADRLAPFAGGEPVTVVLEGMLMYLEEPQVRELLRTLRGLFPPPLGPCGSWPASRGASARDMRIGPSRRSRARFRQRPDRGASPEPPPDALPARGSPPARR